jgi:alcohol dehydrogenase class IV
MSKENFSFKVAGSVIFGNGSLSQLPQVLEELSSKSVCIVTDRGVAGTGILKKLTDILKGSKAKVTTFDEVEPEPDILSVDKCAKLALKNKVDAFIGLVGGSPMDVAKGAAVVTRYSGSIFNYLGVNNVPGSTVTKILIPTTAGTGSEVTPFAIFKDKAKNAKTAIQSKHVVSDISVLDPSLTVSCPPHVTAVCGIDALGHAIESYTSVNASPMSEQFSIEAIGLLGRYILRAFGNGDNAEARSAMALGSHYAGIGIANAGSGSVGALSYPVEGKYHVIHGISNAILMPAIFRYNAVADYEKFEEICEALELDYSRGKDAAERVANFIAELTKVFRFPQRLSDVGAKKTDIKAFAEDAFNRQRILVNNMRKLDLTDIMRIYEEAL